MKTYRVFLLVFIALLASKCIFPSSDKENSTEDAQLVVYCENGILEPVKEFTAYFEEKRNITVHLQNDYARNLINLIHYRKEADVFIPDSRTAIERILNPASLIEDSIFLGYQTLMLYVDSGNPEGFDGSFSSLENPKYSIILANPETSTLGQATRKFLKYHSMYEAVMQSVILLTTDSRGLIRSIVNNQATFSVSWESDYYALENPKSVDTININSPLNHHRAIAVTLQNSPHKEMAKEYLKEMEMEQGQQFFKKYGIIKNQKPKN